MLIIDQESNSEKKKSNRWHGDQSDGFDHRKADRLGSSLQRFSMEPSLNVRKSDLHLKCTPTAFCCLPLLLISDMI
jgi:hypothetical protein